MRFVTPPPSRRETYRGLCYLLFLVCFLPGFLGIVFSLLPFEPNMAQVNFVYYAINFLAVLVIFRKFLMPNLDRVAEAPLLCATTVLFGLARYFIYTGLAGYLALKLVPDFANANDAAIAEMAESDLVLMAIGTILLVPPAEECLFRGLIFRNLLKKSRPAAYLISTAAFSLIHLVGFLGVYTPIELLAAFIQYLPAGLCLGWAYERSGTILPSILIHACVNAFGIYTMTMA